MEGMSSVVQEEGDAIMDRYGCSSRPQRLTVLSRMGHPVRAAGRAWGFPPCAVSDSIPEVGTAGEKAWVSPPSLSLREMI